jgi:rare lipoprotein A
MSGLAAGVMKEGRRFALIALAAASLAACVSAPAPKPVLGVNGAMKPYQVNGVWYRPAEQPHYDQVGMASWYGPQSHYRTTADGEAFDMDTASAAHKTLPLPCMVEVTNLDNGRKIKVRVNDRGPFVNGRILDLSRQGAKDLGFYGQGMAKVRVRYIGPAPLAGSQEARYVSAAPTSPVDVHDPVMHDSSMHDSGAPEQVASIKPAACRVSDGAFADKSNAEREVARLSAQGEARMDPVEHGGGTLWRVTTPCADDRSAR